MPRSEKGRATIVAPVSACPASSRLRDLALWQNRLLTGCPLGPAPFGATNVRSCERIAAIAGLTNESVYPTLDARGSVRSHETGY